MKLSPTQSWVLRRMLAGHLYQPIGRSHINGIGFRNLKQATLRRLRDLGLIEWNFGGYPDGSFWSLTDEGRGLAKQIREEAQRG